MIFMTMLMIYMSQALLTVDILSIGYSLHDRQAQRS